MKIYLLPGVARLKKYCLLGTVAFLCLTMSYTALLPEDQATTLEPISRGDGTAANIAFACNVFWGEEFLPEMLKTLADNKIKITFFIGGTWAKNNPELLRTISEQGHELANHSYNHPHPNALSKAQNQDQILQTESIIQKITGVKTALYAPPYGEYNKTVLKAANELNYSTIMWSVDTIDWQRPPAEIITNRVLNKIHNGAIILMHPTAPTSKSLPILINKLQTRGYKICPVSAII